MDFDWSGQTMHLAREAAMTWRIAGSIVLAISVVLGIREALPGKAAAAPAKSTSPGVPTFQVDPSWPKMEGHFGAEGNWIFGSIGGIAVDPTNDHVWVLQRPRSLDSHETFAAQTPPVSDCCVPAPPVMEFDVAGNFIQGWGGPGPGYDWPDSEHGITVDYRGNIWIAGNGKRDNQVLKFNKAGKFLLQIGHPDKNTGSNDTENCNEPTKVYVYPKTNEVFIADGYINRRVIVFDADTGRFKRLWGAYGNKPDDAAPRIRRVPFDLPSSQPLQSLFEGPPPQQFNLVHAVIISNDDLVYVADRSNNRIQVFKPDGTFVKEAFVARETRTPVGTTIDFAFSPDSGQQFLYVAGGDERIWILNRDTLQVLGRIGRIGHYPGQFFWLHVIACDSKGNIYSADAAFLGRRIQKFVFKGFSSP
jgi:DNA-binding beta-propeller fold protein YncE